MNSPTALIAQQSSTDPLAVNQALAPSIFPIDMYGCLLLVADVSSWALWCEVVGLDANASDVVNVSKCEQ